MMIWTGIILAVFAAFIYFLEARAEDKDAEKLFAFFFKLVVSAAIACITVGFIFLYLSHIGIDVEKYKGLIILAIAGILYANVKNN